VALGNQFTITPPHVSLQLTVKYPEMFFQIWRPAHQG